MAGNSFGKHFRLTTFGESHGPAIGGIIDGCPAGLSIDFEAIDREMQRRRPGQSELTTPRKESDQVEFLSGIYEGKTLGTPIGFIIRNQDAKSKDYNKLKDNYRPSHADKVYQEKYGIRDHRGGGRSSARETACRVVAGAIAKQLLSQVDFKAYVSSVGLLTMPAELEPQFDFIEQNPVRAAHPDWAQKFTEAIEKVRKEGDSLGGVITLRVQGVPIGWGEPVFDKLHAELGKAMLSINAVKGFEIGSGFAGSAMQGSDHNDGFEADGQLRSNHAGGIEGGISNGREIVLRVAFKPVATIMKKQYAENAAGEIVEMQARGRHDPCVVPRAVPIVEAMAALVLVDYFLAAQTNKIL